MHHKDFKNKYRHRKREWDTKEFIAWDGEGTAVNDMYDEEGRKVFLAQPYVTLANSKGDRMRSECGLSTVECFDMILNTKEKYPDSIFVGFGFNYDINQILADVPEEYLEHLYKYGTMSIGGYWMEWRPRKFFTITHRKTKRSARIYDVIGFFQQTFLEACHEYLCSPKCRETNIHYPNLEVIEKGKEDRSSFEWWEMDEKIVPYNNLELSMLVEVMNQLRQDLHEVGIHLSQWHGPGAIANELLKKYNIKISRTVPKEVLDASQYAYAGGRFEHFRVGRHTGRVYEYDIHSAYPAAAFHLPDISDGTWELVEKFESGTFGVWYVEYSARPEARRVVQPQPLFCRSQDGSISFPAEVQGWYWTPEASLVPDNVRKGWVFRPGNQGQPFAFIAGLYDERRVLKMQEKSAQRALKLILNSLYGKLAQTIGHRKGQPPRWHQLEYAGYITSYTRAMIYRAIISNPEAIIAAETDAVFSTEPLDLPVSDELGDWELKEFKEIVYLQSGFYYATEDNGKIVCKYRGMDRDRATQQPKRLSHRKVLDRLAGFSGSKHGFTTDLVSSTTRFVGLGMALKVPSYTWRSWRDDPHKISIDQSPRSSKRYHITKDCPECQDGYTLDECLHTTYIGGGEGFSYPRSIPWRKIEGTEKIHTEAPVSWQEWQEVYQDYLSLEEADRWN